MAGDYFRVKLTQNAKDDLRRIGKRNGKKTYQVIRDLILGLEFEPDKKGQRLGGILRGLFSLHYSRFRIIYQIDREEFVVLVIGAGFHRSGSRRDIYKIVERLIEAGMINVEESGDDAD